MRSDFCATADHYLCKGFGVIAEHTGTTEDSSLECIPEIVPCGCACHPGKPLPEETFSEHRKAFKIAQGLDLNAYPNG